MDRAERILSMLAAAGFQVRFFENRSACLTTRWGQMLLDGGTEAFRSACGATTAEPKRILCGDHLIVARRGAA